LLSLKLFYMVCLEGVLVLGWVGCGWLGDGGLRFGRGEGEGECGFGRNGGMIGRRVLGDWEERSGGKERGGGRVRLEV